jgi:hypothetical protein
VRILFSFTSQCLFRTIRLPATRCTTHGWLAQSGAVSGRNEAHATDWMCWSVAARG